LINLAKRAVQWFGPTAFLRKWHDVPPFDRAGILLAGKYGTPEAKMDLTPSLWMQRGGRQGFADWLCSGDKITNAGTFVFESARGQTQDLEFEEAVRLMAEQKRNLGNFMVWSSDRKLPPIIMHLVDGYKAHVKIDRDKLFANLHFTKRIHNNNELAFALYAVWDEAYEYAQDMLSVDKTRNTWHKERAIDVMMQQLPIRFSVLRENMRRRARPQLSPGTDTERDFSADGSRTPIRSGGPRSYFEPELGPMPPPLPPALPKKKVQFTEEDIEIAEEEINLVGLELAVQSPDPLLEVHPSLSRSSSPVRGEDDSKSETVEEDLTETMRMIAAERYRHQEEDPMLLSLSEERYEQMGIQLSMERERERERLRRLPPRAGGIVENLLGDVMGGGDGGGGGAIAAAVLLMLIVSAMPTHESGGGY
jgi:hypothetical protein